MDKFNTIEKPSVQVYIYKSLDELDYFLDIPKNAIVLTQHASNELKEKYINHHFLLDDESQSHKQIYDILIKYDNIGSIWSFNPVKDIDQYHALDKPTYFCNYHQYKSLDDKINQIIFLKRSSKILRQNIEKKESIFKTKYYLGRDVSNYYSSSDLDIVITSQFSHGGNGVYLIEKGTMENKTNIHDNKIYRAEHYLKESIPVCQTGIVFYDGVVLFEPCIQIIKITNNQFKYSGVILKEISIDRKNIISHLTHEIGDALRSSGYRGVFGCDYHMMNDEILFSELNPRYVGSALFFEKEYKSFSIFKANIDAHQGGSHYPFEEKNNGYYIPWNSKIKKYERYYGSTEGDVASDKYSFKLT